jgi:hypothetical protein
MPFGVGIRNLGLQCQAQIHSDRRQSSSGELLGDESTMSCEDYSVFSALHEETDKGWVWALLDKAEGFTSRMTIKISYAGRSVYCEYRSIDANFVKRYDRSENTKCMYFKTKKEAQYEPVNDLTSLREVIVISDWYRKALGDFGTSWKTGERQKLAIRKPRCASWADLRAACQHPEPGVRVATRVAILGTWLGVTALLPALVEIESVKSYLVQHCLQQPEWYALALSLVFGVFCFFAGRGISRT